MLNLRQSLDRNMQCQGHRMIGVSDAVRGSASTGSAGVNSLRIWHRPGVVVEMA